MATASIWILVLLTITHTGQTQDTPQTPLVMERPGEDVVLPCHLWTPLDAAGVTLEWTRPDLDPRFVYVWHDGVELLTDQNAAYRGRAVVSVDRLPLGDASLTLSDLRNSDSGRYRCYFPKRNQEFFVDLIVGAVSSPAVTLVGADRSAAAVLLRCESAGWYPEPELLWLDGEGTALPAAPAETLRGPDGLYRISSRASVQRTRSNTFTCRVQQKHINQSREAQQHLPEDFFIGESNSLASITVAVLASILAVLVGAAFVWRRRRDQIQNMKMNNSSDQSMDMERMMKNENKKKKKLNERMKIEEVRMKEELNERMMREEEKKRRELTVWIKFEEERKKRELNVWMKIEEERMKIKEERKKTEEERLKIEEERIKLKEERRKIEEERLKIEEDRRREELNERMKREEKMKREELNERMKREEKMKREERNERMRREEEMKREEMNEKMKIEEERKREELKERMRREEERKRDELNERMKREEERMNKLNVILKNKEEQLKEEPEKVNRARMENREQLQSVKEEIRKKQENFEDAEEQLEEKERLIQAERILEEKQQMYEKQLKMVKGLQDLVTDGGCEEAKVGLLLTDLCGDPTDTE